MTAVHRLVGLMFIPNPDNKPEINHDDGNKGNNCVSNLWWATYSENALHAFRTGLNKGNIRAVNQYNLQGNFIKSWESIKEVRLKLGIDGSTISRCCKGKQKTAGGYIWKYKGT